MNARGLSKLYCAGITSPDLLRQAIDFTTASAPNGARLTPSMRINKPLRTWARRLAIAALVVAGIVAVGLL